MSLVGYARVSSAGQSLDVQLDQLQAAGCEKVFSEKQSGSTVKGREALADAMNWAREDDTLVVCRLDRLARSVIDLERIVEAMRAKGVDLKVLHPPIELSLRNPTPLDRMWLSVLGLFAELDNNWRRDRQAEGIARAKAAGKRVYGRVGTIDVAEIRRLMAPPPVGEGLGASAVARKLNIARSSVYRLLEETGNAPTD